jgi:predicted membrane protein
VFAAGLIIVGIGLVISTWYGRAWSLIPIGIVMLAGLSASALIDVPITGGVGQRNVEPTTVTTLQDEYHLGMGELRIDLTDVAEFQRPSETTPLVHIHATVGLGHLLVVLPRDTNVTVHAHAGMGHLQLLDQSDGGIRVDKTEQFTSRPSAPRVDLDLEVGAGEVEVRDAAA